MENSQYGTPKIDKKAISNQKILIPLIRHIYPKLVAQEIIGVQPMITLRQRLFNRKHKEIISDMEIVHTSIRPFMRPGDREPNEHYRPWLEEHIGEQGVDWNWDIHSVHSNSLAIFFANLEHGTLFELTWP